MLRVAVLALAFSASSAAAAQDAPHETPEEAPLETAEPVTGTGFDISGRLSGLSDYRFRGVSRSDEDPALQAAMTVSHDSGLYAGATATTLEGLDSFRLRDPAFRNLGDVELDLYAGYGRQLGDGFSVDGGLLYYVFLGADGATDYAEPYASLSYLIGPVDLSAGAKYAPSQRAIGNEDMLYLFGQVDVSIPFRPWRFSALVGHQDWGRFGDYWTWSLGAEHRLRLGRGADLVIGARYVDTDLVSRPGQDAGAIFSLGLEF